MQAPTSDVSLTVFGPATVFVGEDPASGPGSGSGLDARQRYQVAFDGEAHPTQGYHVELTVSTPRSRGTDEKSRVFWVEPCDDKGGTGSRKNNESQGLGAGGGAVSIPADLVVAAVSASTDPRGGGNPVTSAFTSPFGLASMLLGLLSAAGALMLRRRPTVDATAAAHGRREA